MAEHLYIYNCLSDTIEKKVYLFNVLLLLMLHHRISYGDKEGILIIIA